MSEQKTTTGEADMDGAVEHAVTFDGPMPEVESATAGSRIPPVFEEASWLGTTPVDDAAEAIGLAFTLAGGGQVHLRLDLVSALNVVATLADGLSGHQNRRSHSATSSGIPSREVSRPDEGDQV